MTGQLFDVDSVQLKCTVAGCPGYRASSEEKVIGCRITRERNLGDYALTRPKACIAYPKPDTDRIPY